MTVRVGILADCRKSVCEAPKQITRGCPSLGNRKYICDPHIRDQCRHVLVVVGPTGLVVFQRVSEDLNEPVPQQVSFPRSYSSRIEVCAGHGICKPWRQRHFASKKFENLQQSLMRIGRVDRFGYVARRELAQPAVQALQY
ncbi:MAG: hypothetical protein WBA79_07530 [Mycobacterium sp.]